MAAAPRRRPQSRTVLLDRALEAFPLFRLSDSSEDAAIAYTTPDGGRWRVLPAPGERLPGTFDQDVFVELLRRSHEAGAPADGKLSFTLHEAAPGVVRLELVHAGFVDEGPAWQRTRAGWPLILSCLKTWLETGEPLTLARA